MNTIDKNFDDKTPVEGIVVLEQRAWIELNDGHIVTKKIYNKILKHHIKEVEKHVVYKVQGTVYFVCRNGQPE